MLALRLEQRLIRSVAYERVLENISCRWGYSAGKNKLAGCELSKCILKLIFAQQGHGRYERIGELTPDDSADLGHRFH
jgi:hypothetical protein